MMRDACDPTRPARRTSDDWSSARGGFTLVELLVSISIITLLASMVLVALAGVQETAREDRTRAQIARIDTLISEKWEQYRTRRIPISPAMRNSVRQLGRFNSNQAAIERIRLMEKPRVDMLRELMRMELPDRKSDLLFGPVALPPTSVPAIWHAYRRYAAKLINERRTDVSFPVNDKAIDKQLDTYWSSDFESAECLYLILSQINDQDGKALEYFSEREIGDIDNDGMPEILDAWRRPIIFLRWAPGLNISRNPLTGQFVFGDNIYPGSPQTIKSSDPFDIMNVYPRIDQAQTFGLYPLIASSGPDQQMEIFADNPSETNRITYAMTTPPNNPFVGLPGVPQYQDQVTTMVGTPQDSNSDGILGWIDNITNHNLTGS